IREGAGISRHVKSGRSAARDMASIATRKVSSPVRKRWTDTRGAYRRGPCPPGRRAGTGPVRPGPGSVVLGGCGVVVAVDEADGVDAVALVGGGGEALALEDVAQDRKSTRLNSSHVSIS